VPRALPFSWRSSLLRIFLLTTGAFPPRPGDRPLKPTVGYPPKVVNPDFAPWQWFFVFFFSRTLTPLTPFSFVVRPFLYSRTFPGPLMAKLEPQQGVFFFPPLVHVFFHQFFPTSISTAPVSLSRFPHPSCIGFFFLEKRAVPHDPIFPPRF